MKKTNIMALYEEAVNTVTRDRQRWAHFLDTAANIYKFGFLDQLIIYEQDPNVTACGAKEQWERMGRTVKKNAKQIGLLRIDGNQFKIGYVYDIKETTGKDVYLPTAWEIKKENEKDIVDLLRIGHGIDYTGTMSLREAILKTVESNILREFDGYWEQLTQLIDGSWLERNTEGEAAYKLKTCITATAEYIILKRCGLEMKELDFGGISSFDTLQTINVLGSAGCGIAKGVLTEIEKKLQRQEERSADHGGTGLHGDRERNVETITGGTGNSPSAHEVRIHADAVSGTGDGGGLPGAAGDRQTIQALQTGRGTGAQEESVDRAGAAQDKQTSADREFYGDGELPENDRSRSGGADAGRNRIQQGGNGSNGEIREEQPEPEEKISSGFSITEDFPYEAGDEVFLQDGRRYRVLEVQENYVTVSDTELPLFVRTLNREIFLAYIGRTDHADMPQVKEVQKNMPKKAAAEFNSVDTEISTSEQEPSVILDTLEQKADRTGEPERDSRNIQTSAEKLEKDNLSKISKANNAQPQNEQLLVQEKVDYRIADEHYGAAGVKTRFEKNMDAIRMLRRIEEEKRLATAEEQEILAGYTGWGALPQAFDEKNEKWSKEYERLTGELTPEEYRTARASVLNAYYTPPYVIRAVYQSLTNMGLEKGNVCDPACGIGNFFGAAPQSLEKVKFYGVELDSITARIAKQLYQKADIRQCGFEDTDFDDNFFDAFVGNVPFGEYKIADRRYDKYNFLIHDYFFARALDKVRPGGVVAMLTSKGTMDKANPNVRRYLAQRAELLGAIRLPNDAFKANAGTEVTADILFLQKRERPIDTEPDWIHLEQIEDGVPVNAYFANHPEMILGKMAFWGNMYGNESNTACLPIEGEDLAEQLDRAVKNIKGTILLPERPEQEEDKDTIPADPAVKNYCYTITDEGIYYRENSKMHRMHFSDNTEKRVRGLCQIRAIVRELIDAQMKDADDEAIHEAQRRLNAAYDSFVKKYGRINSKGNEIAFRGDADHPLLCSLEVLDEEDHFKEKAAFFTKRTIRPPKTVTTVDTAHEALIASVAEHGRVDFTYMQKIYGKEKEQILSELEGEVFLEPQSERWVTKEEYLSGNVRNKLEEAIEAAGRDKKYEKNVEALEAVQPEDISAEDIEVRIGSIWIPPSDYKEFLGEILELDEYTNNRISVQYSQTTSSWHIDYASWCVSILASEVYGTSRKNVYEIMEAALNLRMIEVRDKVEIDGKERYVLNAEDTITAQNKQIELQEKFREWIFADEKRRERLVRKYNDEMNNIVPRIYDGSFLRFHGMNPEIELRDYQKNAVARMLFGGNTLLGHTVGAGKTFQIITAVQERKHFGMCSKAMICVPNHLLMQWSADYLRLYPAANILVVTARDFEKQRRRKFCARIATGEYDAVIIGHSQLQKIPMSKEWEEQHIQEQIDEIMDGIEEIKTEKGENWTVKQMEGARKALEERQQRINTMPRDDVLDFEELGIDMLVVDESQEFKNLAFTTKIRNVAGIAQGSAKRASDLFMKCRYLDKITGGRGIIFATGTPVSNAISELFTLQRYLQFDLLKEKGLAHFVAWVSVYAETKTAMELAPSGRGFRLKTRLSTYFNLNELCNMFALVADIKTAADINIPVPKIHGGEPENIVIPPTPLGEEIIESLVERSERIRKKQVSAFEDNMLLVTNDGRKAALDVRCFNALLPDEGGNKVEACVEKIYEIWKQYASERAAQLVFCDLSTPKELRMEKNMKGEYEAVESPFNVYQDIKNKLVKKGIPENEIAFIHDAKTDLQKAKLFAKVRKGAVRVLIGSTFKMGAGMNVQDRLVALHHLDAPWRPSDLIQREGRILRWGNMFQEVRILRYLTERSFDAYIYQLLENKQRFINQIVSNKPPARRMEDVDVSSEMLRQIKALATGDPRVIRKSELDTEITKLRIIKRQYQAQQFRLQKIIESVPQEIQELRKKADLYGRDHTAAEEVMEQGFRITVGDEEYTDKATAWAVLVPRLQEAMSLEDKKEVGSFAGLHIFPEFNPYESALFLILVGEARYSCEMKRDGVKNIDRIIRCVNEIPEKIKGTQERIERLENQFAKAQDEIGRPFGKEQELQDMIREVTRLNLELNLDAEEPLVVPEQDELQPEEAEYAK